jgi:hypothetical protein
VSDEQLIDGEFDLLEGNKAIAPVDDGEAIQVQAVSMKDPLTDAEMERVERAIIEKNYSGLDVRQRWEIYKRRCEQAGVDPMLGPLMWGKMDGKTTLLRTKILGAAQRDSRNISARIAEMSMDQELGIILVRTIHEAPDGRVHEDVGVESIAGLRAQDLGDAIMKAVTKAHSRTSDGMFGTGGSAMEEVRERRQDGIKTIDPSTGKISFGAPPTRTAEAARAGALAVGPRPVGPRPVGTPPSAAEALKKAAEAEGQGQDTGDVAANFVPAAPQIPQATAPTQPKGPRPIPKPGSTPPKVKK